MENTKNGMEAFKEGLDSKRFNVTGEVYILRVSDGLQVEICAFSSRKKAEQFVASFQPGKAQQSDIVHLIMDQTKIM